MSSNHRVFSIPELLKVDSVSLYETPQRFLLVGCVRGSFSLVKVDRRDPHELELVEDQHIYSLDEINGVLATLQAKKTCSGVGVLGFVKFVQGWYMLIIVAKRVVGLVGTHKIFAIDDSTVVPLGNVAKTEHEFTRVDEARYKRLFFGMDLSSFYFSYTYNLTSTLQKNMCLSVEHAIAPDEKFCWNWYLSEPVRKSLSDRWFLPIIQGFVGSSTYAAHFDHSVRFTLISRRSQYYAGTRYLKRGVSEAGHVANDVETEQIVQELFPVAETSSRLHLSSFVQIRGSVPLFWAQENTFAIPKPDITVMRGDPFHEAAVEHFSDVMERYGAPVMVLNLVKHHEKRPRETILLDGFSDAVETINASLPPPLHLVYIAWDFHARTKKEAVAGSLLPIARATIRRSGYFHTGTLNGAPRHRREEQVGGFSEWEGREEIDCRGRAQQGVLRSNCVDCLDRTNAAQLCIGVAALGEQLYAMGLTASPLLEFRSHLVALVLALYEEMGDAIAVQYAGSLLAHRMNSYATSSSKTASSASRWSAVSKDLLTSIKRYYTSTFTDVEKQASINLFLGRFRPYDHPAYEPMWDLPSDAALHAPPPSAHRRPLWTQRWWEGPLARFSMQLRPFQLPCPPPARPLLIMPVFVRYTDNVSDRFVSAYRPTVLTLFDELLSKPHLRINRSPDYVVAGRSALASTPAGPPDSRRKTSEYGRFLSAFASWVQGGTADLPKPLRPNDSRMHKKDDRVVEESNARSTQSPTRPIEVNPNSLMKYAQYTQFASDGVWEHRPGEKVRLENYMEKCFDTTLVSLSPDFVPSQAFYSAYLMDASTSSFQPSHDSVRVYETAQPSPPITPPPPIDQIAPKDWPLLFVDASTSKWSNDPHPLPRRF